MHHNSAAPILVPPGYVLEEAPPPVKQDLGFMSYSSQTELVDGTLRYTRTFELREVSIPATSYAD